MTKALSSEERKTLKKEKRPAMMLGVLLFAGISITNLVIYYQDIILGTEGLERPPIIQLIIIEIAALAVGFSTYYFPSKKVIKDLSVNEKLVEENAVQKKFIRNVNGKPEYTVRLANNLLVSVDKSLYSNLSAGDTVKVSFAPLSSHIFSTERVTNNA